MLLLLPSAPRAQYYALETEDLRLLYNKLPHGFLANYTAQCFENSMLFYRRVFGYEPDEKVTVLLDDSYDFNNAAAFSSPRNTLLVQIAPASTVYETLPANERINHTMNHEMAHIVALDQAAGSDRFFRNVFGGKVTAIPEHPETILYEYLTHPRFAAPRWYHEGLAVFLETWMAGGLGRAQGVYDEMVFRAKVRDGAELYDPMGLESEGTKTDFQLGANSYLYGTRFMSWLAYQEGPEKLIEWAARSDGTKKYFASQFHKLYGTSVGSAWKQWLDWEKEFQVANLDSIRKYPRTPFTDIASRALGSISRAYVDHRNHKMYAALNYPGVLGHIAAISLDDGSIEKICDVKGPTLYFVTSLAYDPQNQKLFYTADNNEWRDLHVVDIATKKERRLIKDARIGDLAFDSRDGSLWGVRHFNGRSTLVRIPAPYTSWTQVYTWPYGQDAYDLDLSPDGRWLSFSLSEISGRQTLRLIATDDFAYADPNARLIYDFAGFLPSNFVFSPDGRYLYGSSYYTGVSNIWRYDVAADSMDAVSNTETGLFRPTPLSGDSLIVFRYAGDGFVPAFMEARPLQDLGSITLLGYLVRQKHPVVREWNVGSPGRVQLEPMIRYEGRYKTLQSIGLASVYPVVEGYKDYAAVGLRMNLSDPGFWNSAAVTLSYTPTTDLDEKERLHGNFHFARRDWTFDAKLNDADFYDLFGPTKTSYKGYAFGLRYNRNLLYDRPKNLDLEVSSAFHGDLERLPYAQNVAASFDKLWSSYVTLDYRNVRRSLGAVDEEKGFRWGLGAVNNHANSQSHPIFYGTFDAGTPALITHSSLWLRTAAGYSPGERDEPFANFFFGGFGNNWVDRLDEKRYREYGSFPGVEIDDIGGVNFTKAMLEWNLPPWRFKRAGIPSFYASWARTALFTSAIVTNLDEASARRTVANAGGQVDLRFSLLSRLKMILSLGYAVAFEKDEERRDEFMFSLKVL